MPPALARFRLPLLLTLLQAGCGGEEASPDHNPIDTGDATTLADSGVVGDSSAAAGAPLGRASGLPCEVQELLAGYCVSCHGMPPTGGAPRSLLTHADLTVVVPGGSKKVAQLALTMMQDSVMPPTAARPSAAQIAGFAAWLERGAPEVACGKVP